MARKVRDQKQHSAPEEGSGNAKKAKEQNLKIQCEMEEVMYINLEHTSHNNSILKFIKDVASSNRRKYNYEGNNKHKYKDSRLISNQREF